VTTEKKRKFSPSSINEFYACPKQWRLHRREGIAKLPVETIPMEFGAVGHVAIKEYFETVREKPTADQIQKLFTAIFDENLERSGLPVSKERVDKIRDNFIHFEQERLKGWKVYKPTLVETVLETDIFTTIVDFYSESEQTLIDWKFGNKNDVTDDDLRQGKIMEIVLRTHGHKVSRILFVALFPNRRFEIPQLGDGFVENEVRKMEDDIKTNYFPKVERYCSNCDVLLDCQLEECCLWLM